MRNAVSRTTLHAPRTSPAFTLVEILVTIALLAIITLGLFATFNQVQRAFRSSMNQVDRLEAGRAVTGMIPAELEQTTPSNANATNFYAQIVGSTSPFMTPLTQNLPGTATPPMRRTNLLEDCFMLQRQNQTWIGIGYCVRTNDANGNLWFPETGPGSGQLGVGSLYRFTATLPVIYNPNDPKDPRNGLPNDPGQLYALFKTAALNGSRAISNRICDGVIHFYLATFATNGFPLILGTSFGTNVACFRPDAISLNPPYSIVHPVRAVPNYSCPGNLAALYFWSNAVPASVELQLGILELHAWERYNSIGDPTARFNYLQRDDTASRVQLFRQRIPIRNVNPSAYQ
jgi:prepilin-type N-terminal cleavage/methylation domain-containing protein